MTVPSYRDRLGINFRVDLTRVNLQAGHLVHPSNLNRWDMSNSTLSRRRRRLGSTGPTLPRALQSLSTYQECIVVDGLSTKYILAIEGGGGIGSHRDAVTTIFREIRHCWMNRWKESVS